MNTKKSTGIFDRFATFLDDQSNSTNSREIIFWGSTLSVLIIGLIVSVTAIVAVQRSNNLEERAKLMRMCREDPRFDIKTCTALLKPPVNRTTKGSSGLKKSGYGRAGSDSGNDERSRRLSDLNMGPAVDILK